MTEPRRSHVDLAVDDDEIGALVDLVLLERFSRGQLIAIDRASPGAECRIRGWCGSTCERPQIPVLHAAIVPGGGQAASSCATSAASRRRVDRLPDEARDVHLRDADAVADLGLREVFGEAQAQDLALAVAEHAPSGARRSRRPRRGRTRVLDAHHLRHAVAASSSSRGAVVFPEGAVDPYNGKCVRASAGSIFHVRIVRGGTAHGAVLDLRAAGFNILAADAQAPIDLDEYADAGHLAGPTAWLFGSEAHGLSAEVVSLAHTRIKVPIHGRAESLNLAAAAAVCLYASARAQRRP